METTTLKEAVQMYVEAFEKADLSIIRKLYAVDATLEDPVGSPARHGIEEIIEFYKAGFAMGMKLKGLASHAAPAIQWPSVLMPR